MAATVSGFLGFAISKVVDQFWTPTSECEHAEIYADAIEHSAPLTAEPAVTETTKATPRKNATVRRNARRTNKMQPIKTVVAIALPLDVKPRAYSDADPVELSSNASTCGASDDEEEVEEVEDIGAKEMRLMLERADEIKRLTKQSRQQQRQKDARGKNQATKAKEDVVVATPTAPTPAAIVADACTPIRIQNTTNGLWNYSVYSGFAVDTKVANRGPRNMRHLYCTLIESETLESEEMLLDLAAQVLAEN